MLDRSSPSRHPFAKRVRPTHQTVWNRFLGAAASSRGNWPRIAATLPRRDDRGSSGPSLHLVADNVGYVCAYLAGLRPAVERRTEVCRDRSCSARAWRDSISKEDNEVVGSAVSHGNICVWRLVATIRAHLCSCRLPVPSLDQQHDRESCPSLSLSARELSLARKEPIN